MSLYAVVLFVHVVGAVGLFATLALEWLTLRGLSTATTVENARGWLQAQAPARWLGLAAFAAILFAGMYLAASARVEAAWVAVGLMTLLAIGIIGMVVTGRRMAPIGCAVAGATGALPPDVAARLRDPYLWTSLVSRTALALGAVWLMTVKPDLVGSLIAMGAAIVLGLAASLPAWSRARLERAPA